jgi:ankyrin repeat protein
MAVAVALELCLQGKLEQIKTLLDQGLDVNTYAPVQKKYLITAAAERGNLELVKLLLERNAYVNAVPILDDRTPLWHAASNGDLAMVQLLLQHDADVNVCAHDDGTYPFHMAVQGDYLDICKLLIDRIEDINRNTLYGPPIYVAAANSTELLKFLLEHKADPNEICMEPVPLLFVFFFVLFVAFLYCTQ